MAVSYSDRLLQPVDVISSFRWSAIIAGLFAALACQVVLSAIGGAIGISAAATAMDNEGAAKGLGIGAGIWMVLSPLVSMFVGASVAVWLARPLDRGVALMHGGLVWCLSLVIGAFLVASIASSAVTGLLGTAGNVAGDAAGVVASDVSDDKKGGENLRADAKEAKAEAKAKANDPEVKKAADDAADVGTGVAWASVFAMLLSLGAALIGAGAAHKNLYEPANPRTRRPDPDTRIHESHLVSPSGTEIRSSRTLDDRADLH